MTNNSISDVAAFVQVVESGSFTAAAGRLKLSKSVVSKHVSRLEDRLGARLLNRTTRRLSLTEVGRVFYERSRRGIAELAEAEAEVSRLQEAPRGRLKLNVPMTFGILHIAPAIPDFLARHPELTVDMELDDRRLDLIEEGFDVAVRISRLPDSSLVARRLGTCRHAVCASPAYLERRGTPRTPGDLARHDVLTYRYQSSADHWHFVDPEGNGVSVPVRGRVTMNNGLALREALLAGVGIARSATFVVGPDIRAGRVVELLPGYRSEPVSIYALYPERRHLSPKVRAFVDFMADRMAEPGIMV